MTHLSLHAGEVLLVLLLLLAQLVLSSGNTHMDEELLALVMGGLTAGHMTRLQIGHMTMDWSHDWATDWSHDWATDRLVNQV